MPFLHSIVAVLITVAVAGIARADPEQAPEPVDPARLNEHYVIEPGAEKLFGDMLGGGDSLPGGCTLRDGKIERTSVVGIYTCGGGEVVLELLHPETAPPEDVRTQRFAIAVKSGVPPAGLVDAVAGRIRTREKSFTWKDARGETSSGGALRWAAPVGGGVVVAILVFWALRRLVAR